MDVRAKPFSGRQIINNYFNSSAGAAAFSVRHLSAVSSPQINFDLGQRIHVASRFISLVSFCFFLRAAFHERFFTTLIFRYGFLCSFFTRRLSVRLLR